MYVSCNSTWIIEILQNALNAWNEKLQQVFEILTTSPQNFGGGAIYDVIENINGAMQSVGLGLLVLFMLAGIVKQTMSYEEMKRPEYVFKLLLRFAIAKGVISYGMPLMSEIFSVSLGIIGQMGTAQFSAITLPAEITQAAQDASFLQVLFPSVLALIGSLVMTVVSIMILLTVLGRLFKIYMYMAISPIPLSTFAGDATKQIGFSFLKSFAGVCLEGAMIMLACIIYSAYVSFVASLTSDTSGTLVNMLYSYILNVVLNMFILLGLVKGCDKIVHEMLGV